MRSANVLRNGELVGVLNELDNGHFEFTYDLNWLIDSSKPAVSLGMPKEKKKFESTYLFSFFFNMLSEGVNKKTQNQQFKIDEEDHFGLLLATARFDTIGAITIERIKS